MSIKQWKQLVDIYILFIGKVNENNQICGHLGYAIHDKLYYWNGHLVSNKYDNKLKYVDFDTYSYDYIGSQWSKDMQCLIIDKNKNLPHKMTNKEMNIYAKILERENLKHYIIPNDL